MATAKLQFEMPSRTIMSYGPEEINITDHPINEDIKKLSGGHPIEIVSTNNGDGWATLKINLEDPSDSNIIDLDVALKRYLNGVVKIIATDKDSNELRRSAFHDQETLDRILNEGQETTPDSLEIVKPPGISTLG